MNNGNMAPYVKEPVDGHLGIRSTLRVSYVHLYNSYIRLRRCFDNLRLRRKSNIIKDMRCFENVLYNLSRDRKIHVFGKIRDT